MTEKRFTITQDFEEQYKQIRDNGHVIMGCFLEAQVEVIVDLLNELHEEKEYWKEKYKQELEKNSIMTVAFDKQGNAHILLCGQCGYQWLETNQRQARS